MPTTGVNSYRGSGTGHPEIWTQWNEELPVGRFTVMGDIIQRISIISLFDGAFSDSIEHSCYLTSELPV